MHREPGRAGKGEHARDVVVHPVLVDGGECHIQMLGRLRPSATIHRQQRELGLAEDAHIGVGV